MKFIAIPILLLSALVAQAEVTEAFKQSLPLSEKGSISLENINGSVEVVGWDKPELSIEAEKKARNEAGLRDIEIKVQSTPDHIKIETVYKKHLLSGSHGSVRYTVHVPAGASLANIETVNASIKVSAVRGSLKLETVNGSIHVKNLADSGSFETVNGSVEVEADRLPKGAKLTLDTVNGSLDLKLPSDVGASIEADTVNGRVSTDFSLSDKHSKKRHLRGVIGDGAADIELDTVNGSIQVLKR